MSSVLNGWYTAPGGGTKIGNAGDSYTVTEDIILYAQWTASTGGGTSGTDGGETTTHTIVFNARGGSSIAGQNAASGSSITLPTTTRNGYTLNGWYTAPGGGTKIGNAGDSYTVTGDIILYAQWTVIIYTVTFNANGGNSVSAQSAAFGSSIALPDTTRNDAYTLEGWYTASSGGTKIGNAGDSYTVSGNITLYAQWTFYAMASIAGGTFTMGSPDAETNRNDDEKRRRVKVSDFLMGKYEVTRNQYQAVMGTEPSRRLDDAQGEIQGKFPVEQVSWYDAIEFCNALSRREGLTPAYDIDKSRSDPNNLYPTDNLKWTVTWDKSATGYRLPTEAEWEYACRAGTTTAYNTGDTITDSTGWYKKDGNYGLHEVGKKPANAWGLYDMHGSIDELCWDWYGDYGTGPQIDPTGAASGKWRVLRGGAYSFTADMLRSAQRGRIDPSYRDYTVGIRLVRSF
jgi:uncharacterized repeat protein (TIGR02543 family)